MIRWLLLILLSFKTLLIYANPLPANEVFKVDVKVVDPNTFTINWQIRPNYFLYSDRIKLSVPEDSNAQLGSIPHPPTLTKTDKKGQTYSVYRNELTLPIGILGEAPGESLIDLQYQGCSDDGFCYPPEKTQIKVAINEHRALDNVSLEAANTSLSNKTTSEHDNITKLISNNHWWVVLISFFSFGLLLSFTPCILPMVPVLSGIIVGHGQDVTTRKAFFLSLSYVLSMSVTYAIIGAVVALAGANLQISMQSPLAISLFSLLFIMLALSMFGFYEFKLPQSWQAKIAGSSRSQRGGHYIGAAVMGSLSTLILSPCVTAPLIGVLSYIAQTGNVLLGMVTLFVLSLGMGTPLLLIGMSAGKWLPEAGSWMNMIKALFGIMFIAIAIYLMSRIIPPSASMALWAALLIFSGIYSGAFNEALSAQDKFCRGIGIILLSYGLLILIGTSMGNTNPLQPLSNLHACFAAEIPSPKKQTYTLNTLEEAIRAAKGKPVMLDFYADWCASCQVIEATVLRDPRVGALLDNIITIKVDVTANSAEDKKIMDQFHVVAPPTFIFFNADGKPLDQLTIVGESSTEEFLSRLDQLKSAT